MEKMIVAAFYKYVDIAKPEKFRKEHLEFCNSLAIKGRILVAEEGINGSVSGTREQIEEYKNNLRKNIIFSDIVFKEDECLMHPFKKMVVKVKKEIVNFGQDVDLNKTGKHLSPEEFLNLYNSGEDVLILDARNEYESRVGKFAGAITPKIKTFRDFPKVIEELKDKKDKKIIMYCTGGIRCEKASAYMIQQGFSDVSQLEGGILNFGKNFPNTIWEGKCFVFDKRLISSVNEDEKDRPITNCEVCQVECDLYKNCANNSCDKFCIICIECEKNLGGCCSRECFIHKQNVILAI